MRFERRLAVLGLALGMGLVCPDPQSAAQRRDEERAPRPWDGLGEHLGEAFFDENSLFHLAAVGVTWGMAPSGADYHVYRFVRDHPALSWVSAPIFILGYVAPFAAVGTLYGFGWANDDLELLGAGSAVVQASVVGALYVAMLKLVTSRPDPPDYDSDLTNAELREESETFRWGIGRGGIAKGWPSGHTMTAFTVGITLASYYDAWWIDALAWTGVAYMMFGMVAFEGVHWASDVLAGALMAYPISTTIGRGFRRRVDGSARPESSFGLAPLVTHDRALVLATGSF